MLAATPLQLILSVVAGSIVGFSLGLIGGGGSILAVPLLLYFVGYHDPHIVLGTTALAVALTAYVNVIPHWRAGNLMWKPAIAFAIPGAIGALVGSNLGKLVPGKQLLFLFALMMIFVAIAMLRGWLTPKKDKVRTEGQTLKRVILVSTGAGLLSGFFGIGGGFLIVPGLIFATGMPIINAIGSSLVSVGAFGTTTALTYALAGKVNWLIAVAYFGGGILGGRGGAVVATRLSKNRQLLTRIFSAIIIGVAIYMLIVNASALGIHL